MRWKSISRWIVKTLRFLNLLEPGEIILSISKIFMWLMMFCVVYVMVIDPASLAYVISAVGGAFVSTANYSWRRYVQWKTGKLIGERDHGYRSWDHGISP